MKNIWLGAVSLLLVGMTTYVVWKQSQEGYDLETLQLNQNIVERTFSNYHDQLSPLAEEYDIPESYLLALAALECSGRKIVPHRFEPHVYGKLLQVKQGELDHLEMATSSKLKSVEQDELRALASSWGPFQIMGYKCFELEVSISVLKGPNNAEHAVRWISENYGKYLQRKRFKDAFHYHNTGRKYPLWGPPRTYHTSYVPQGLKYMIEFRQLLADKS